jgi:hypothetical protein
VVVSPHVAGLAPTIGRQRELQVLREAFLNSAEVPAVQVLTGMGGVGKTSLARAYAQRHRADYPLIWWVRAEDPATIDAEFRALLEVLLPPGEATKISDARTAAFAQLAQHPGPWLLVLDNAEDVADLLPPAGHGHVLITTRSAALPHATTIHPLDPPAAVELLITQSGDDDPGTAETLATELGNLPLALTQAAGFTRTHAMTLATYLRLYRNREADLHQQGRPADYLHTIATTWQLAIDRLSADARKMLNVIAFYAPDAIPLHLIFGSWDEWDRHRAIGELHGYGLITRTGSEMFAAHRLVQAVTRNRLHDEVIAHEWSELARELIVAAMPRKPTTANSLSSWNVLRTHLPALLDHLPPEQASTLEMRHERAHWIGEAGEAVRARDLFAELLPIQERVLDPEHPDTLRTRGGLAHWTGVAGDVARARDLYTDMLPVCERALGAENPFTMNVWHALAFWIGTSNDTGRALDLSAELLAIRERVLGAEHPDVMATRRNVAHWIGLSGDPARARDLFAGLIPIAERVLGAESRDTLSARQALALWTGEAGDAERARDLFAELLPIRERVLGAEYPGALRTRHELAYWTGQAGDAARARDLFAELLPIRERVLGAGHADTEKTRQQLAHWTELAAAEEVGPGVGGET